MKKIKLHHVVGVMLCFCCGMMLTSCIKDEPLNTECDILAAWVEGDEYAAK